MNLFSLDITKNCLIGQCWVPDQDLIRVNEVLERCSILIEILNTRGDKICPVELSDHLLFWNQTIAGTNVASFISKTETTETPPTYHRTNKFTHGFQAMINAYGDSRYRELNPGLYTVITFPFLFAIMFGDLGHGIIMILFSGWMVVTENKYLDKQSSNEIWNIFFGGRYVILLMGIFSTICGFLYNDIFSKQMYLMESYWKNTFTLEEISSSMYLTLDPAKETTTPYALGIDPVWEFAANKIMYQNSLKMKISIIIGITHMLFGLILSLFNHIYFKQYYKIILQFIPQVLFLCCIFLWLVILIYIKWFMFSSKTADVKKSAGCAPLILILFIDMTLFSTSKPVEKDCDAYMFAYQYTTQKILVIIALISVPILFLGTPLYKHNSNKKKRREAVQKVSQFRRYQQRDGDLKSEDLMLADIAKYSVPLGEIFIHQAIHSIEFVLSTVSHTASYLRLWALSLAHHQLSDMLWHMILSKLALRDRTAMCPVKIYLIFIIWAVFTVTILVVMEGLSAFLHTLRLHWVEFMSKFYEGGGYPFRPFNLKDLYEAEKDKGLNAACKKGRRE